MKKNGEKRIRPNPLGLLLERIALFADILVSALLPRRKSKRNDGEDLTNDVQPFINTQGSAEMRRLTYGSYPLSYNGCGIIAAYNALTCSGKRASVRNITEVFLSERVNTGGALFRCKYGTNPMSMPRALKKLGFDCRRVRADSVSSDGLYVAAYWSGEGGFFSPAHFITVETKGGTPIAYNESPRGAAVTISPNELKKTCIRCYKLTAKEKQP